MFMGEYNHTVDTNGRLIIPTKFREQLGEEFVVTKGMTGCLIAFPQEEWTLITDKLRTFPLTQEDAIEFMHFFVSGAMSCELDRQGRILLPATLRKFADLDKDVVMTGMINRFEIWDRDRWEETYASGNYRESARKMAALGLNI